MSGLPRRKSSELTYDGRRIRVRRDVYEEDGVEFVRENEVMHFFVARDLSPCAVNPDPGEKIEVVRMSVREALAGIRGGTITDGKTVIGLMMTLEQSA